MLHDHDKQSPDAIQLTRRHFLEKTAIAVAGVATASTSLASAAEGPPKAEAASKPSDAKDLPNRGRPIKIFCCDFNFCRLEQPSRHVAPSAPQDWAFVNPEEYFNWHRDFGVNCMFCQPITLAGYAFYPTKLGPLAPGPGSQLLGELFKRSRKASMSFSGYFSIAIDRCMQTARPEWLVPGTDFLAPENPWTDLLCARITEFLRQYPVEWINFDAFTYGKYQASDFKIRPEWYVKKPFREIIGREMPDDAAKITADESLEYMREVLARQFHRIQEAMHLGNPGTKANFNPPYFAPDEPLWVNHPMVNESDQLVAESTDDVVPWLLRIRNPHQRVMTVIVGRPGGLSKPDTWKRWYEAGCDFFGYAWGTPPDFRPHPKYAKELEITRSAYHEMA